jgi:hypothetical protein
MLMFCIRFSLVALTVFLVRSELLQPMHGFFGLLIALVATLFVETKRDGTKAEREFDRISQSAQAERRKTDEGEGGDEQ